MNKGSSFVNKFTRSFRFSLSVSGSPSISMNNFTIICLIAVGPFIYGSLIRTTIMNEIGSDDYDDYDETITPSTTENDMSFTQQMLVDNSGENSEQGTTFIKNRNADLSTLFKRTIENLRHKNKKVI